MDKDQRDKIVRLTAIHLLHDEIPGAPAGAVGPPSKWWSLAAELVDTVAPYFREVYQ